MKAKLILVLLFFCTSFFSFSQQEIQVELKDSETNEPISFATVRFEGTNRGLVADYDGQFRLPYKVVDSIPKLLVTSLGYKPTTIIPKELKLSGINIIYIVPQIESLNAVILNVSKRDKLKGVRLKGIIKETENLLAYDIVNRAIKFIPKNLNQNPYSSIGYYRDYQFIDNEYYNLNEGILEQFDFGILSKKTSDNKYQGVFYSLKQNSNFKISDQYARNYDGINKFVQNARIMDFGGNELSILNVHNPIRNYNTNSFSYVYQLNKDFVYNHDFRKSRVYLKDGEPIIDIIFSTRTKKNKSFGYNDNNTQREVRILKNKVNGKLSISLKDFAIYRFDYSMYDNSKTNPLFNIKIEYRKQSDKMYLNYISFNNRFVIAEEHAFEPSEIIYNKGDSFFEVSLTSGVDSKTVKRRNFKIKFNGKRIIIKSADILNPKKIRIDVKDFDGSLQNLSSEDITTLSFVIKNMKDLKGREIYKRRTLIGYQFREFFVQEIFENKNVNENLKFLDKVKPLFLAPINPIQDIDKYIINSPLQKRKIQTVN